MHRKNMLAGFGIATVLSLVGVANAATPYTVTVVPGRVTITAAAGWHIQRSPVGQLTCKSTDASGKATETKVTLTATDTTATATGHGACKLNSAVYNPSQELAIVETITL